MRPLRFAYEKITEKTAPYYYDYSILKIIGKPVRKFMSQVLVPNCPFNNVRIFLYRLCGFKIGRNTTIGACTLANQNILEAAIAVNVPYRILYNRQIPEYTAVLKHFKL